MSVPCQKAGCTSAATHALRIAVPSVLEPDDVLPAVGATLQILLCEEHVDEADPQAFLASNPALGQVLNVAAAGGPALAFSRAVCIGVPMSSPEYQALALESWKQKGH